MRARGRERGRKIRELGGVGGCGAVRGEIRAREDNGEDKVFRNEMENEL